MSIIGNRPLASAAVADPVIAGPKSAVAWLSASGWAAPEYGGMQRHHRRRSWIGGGLLMARSHLLAISSGLAIVCFCYATASANPAPADPVDLTWNPSASSPALSSTTGPFTFNDITIEDYSSIYLTPTGANTFSGTETGFIPFVAFANNGTITTPTTLNNHGAANPFGIYGEFTATSTLTCSGAGAANCTGVTTSLSLKMIGDPGYHTTFAFNATTGNPVANHTSGNVTLATGSLANCGAPSPTCQNQVGQSNGIPTAAITTTFVPEISQSGFFDSPSIAETLNLLGSFTNSSSQVLCFAAVESFCGTAVAYGGNLPSGAPAGAAVLFEIGNTLGGLNPGGGSINFVIPVPEPTSLGLLGSALIGLVGIGWGRKAARSAKA